MPCKTIIACLSLLLFCFVSSSGTATASVPPTLTKRSAVRLQLKWRHQFQFAGFYAAQIKGYYKEAGLNVELLEGGPEVIPVEAVLAQKAEFGVANSELLIHRLNGKPVVALAVIFQHSPSIFLSRRDSGIMSPEDMIGKRVMLREGIDSAELLAVFKNEGISIDNIKRQTISYDINDLIDGNTDVYHAYISDQAYYLQQRNIPISIIQPRTYGIDFYGDTLFTTEAYLAENPEIVKAFRAASLRGWDYAMNHIDEMVSYILSTYHTEKSRSHLRFEAESMKKLLQHEAKTMLSLLQPELIEVGHMNAGRWRHIADTCAGLGMTERDYDLEGFLYSPEPDYGWVRQTLLAAAAIGLMALLIILTLIAFNRRLKRLVDQRTRELKAANANLLQHQEHLEELILERTKDLETSNQDLTNALGEVKTLTGLIPICASCKKVRDDEGYWNQIESYIKAHSDADFSHSICPDCIQKLYPGLDDK